MGFGALIADGEASPSEVRDFADDIMSSGRHLLSLINTILDTASVEAGRLELAIEPTPLDAVIHDVASTMRPTADKKHIALRFDLDASIATVQLDPRRLRQILYNYVSNAVKFTSPGGAVTLRTHRDDGYFRLEVEDTGVGIAPSDIPALFSEFSGLRNADATEGTGLGLALTKRLVEAHGGQVGVDSTPGKGSTFYARLPIKSAAPPTPRS
jgi:signal transduction histidine kinase